MSELPKSPYRVFAEKHPELETLFRRFTNAHFTASADEYREGASDSSVKRHDDAMLAAQDAFIAALLAKLP